MEPTPLFYRVSESIGNMLMNEMRTIPNFKDMSPREIREKAYQLETEWLMNKNKAFRKECSEHNCPDCNAEAVHFYDHDIYTVGDYGKNRKRVYVYGHEPTCKQLNK